MACSQKVYDADVNAGGGNSDVIEAAAETTLSMRVTLEKFEGKALRRLPKFDYVAEGDTGKEGPE